MNRTQLIEKLSIKTRRLNLQDTEAVIEVLLAALKRNITQGRRIEIRGFGCFSVHHRAPYLGRNPKNGESVAVPAKKTIHFKPGQTLKHEVNESGRTTNLLTKK